MQAARASVKAMRAERMVRALPLWHPVDLCHELLGQRMFLKWLQAVKRKPSRSVGAVTKCEALQIPEYWPFHKYLGLGHFVLEYK